jgi:hypothetical protein
MRPSATHTDTLRRRRVRRRFSGTRYHRQRSTTAARSAPAAAIGPTPPLVTVYPIYTPKHAGSVGIDYIPLAIIPKLTVHPDGNYTTRQYTMATDPTLSDNGFIVNARLILGEMPLNSVTGLQLSLWSRNLFDEAHTFVKNFNAALGRYGIFNEPRTFGIDGTVRFWTEEAW